MDNCGDNLEAGGPVKTGDTEEAKDKFIDECLVLFKPVGESASLLMESIDRMHEATEMLVQQEENDCLNEAAPKEDVQNLQRRKRKAKEHIMNLERTVLYDKDKTAESLRKFIKFLEHSDKKCTYSTAVSSCYFKADTDNAKVKYKQEEEYTKRVLNENEELSKQVSYLQKCAEVKDNLEKTWHTEKEYLKQKIKQLSKFENEIDTLTDEILSIQMELNDKDENNRENMQALHKEHTEEKNSWKSVETVLRSDIKNLESQVAKHIESIQQLERQNSEKETNIQNLFEEIENFKKEKQSLEIKAKSQSENISLLENDLKNCKIQNEKDEENLKNHKSDILKLEKTIDSLETEKLSLKCQISKLNDTVEGLDKSINAVRHENQKQKEQIENLTVQIQNIEKEKVQMQTTIELCKDNVKRLETNIEEMKSDLERNHGVIKELENERDCLITKYNNSTQENDKLNNEIKRSSKMNSELQTKADEKDESIQQLQQELSDHKNDLKTMEEIKSDLEQENGDLTTMLKESQSQSKKLEKEQTELHETLNKIKLEFSETVKDRENQIQKLSICKDELNTTLETAQRELRLSQSDAKSLRYELDMKKVTNEKLEGEVQEKDSIIFNLKATCEKEKKELNEEIQKINYKHGELSRESKEYRAKAEDTLANLKERLTMTQNKYDNNIRDKEGTIKRLEQRIKEKYEEIENVSKVLCLVEAELTEIKSTKKMQVQLYSPNRTQLADCVEEGLTALLKERLETDKLKLEFIQCSKSSDIQPELPVLLLCITVSRLGTDVANCVQGLTLNSKIALLVFHHKDVHALPNQASDRVLTGADMKALGGICDMAFLSGKGIYSCDMNKNNVISLINFLGREGVEKSILAK